nr:hypothetical protein Itr_chr15CG11730 [Ipomoea trifida]
MSSSAMAVHSPPLTTAGTRLPASGDETSPTATSFSERRSEQGSKVVSLARRWQGVREAARFDQSNASFVSDGSSGVLVVAYQ